MAVGEPGGVTGYLHVYTSTGDPASPYSLCGSYASGSQSFGSAIAQTNIDVPQGVSLLVGTIDADRLDSYDVTYSSGCSFAFRAEFSGVGVAGSRWGQSLAEISVGLGMKLFLVGAPRDNSNAGQIYSKDELGGAITRYSGTAQERFGVSVAARSDSSFFAFNAPYSSEGGTAHVKRQTFGTYSDKCAVSIPMSDLADTAAQSLAHLNGLFSSFLDVGAGTVGFASYRSETTTGGSVGLFGVSSLSCGTVKQVNNCQSDSGQKQGEAVTGGTECITSGGTKIMVVGAPGFSSGAGRIDIYAEGSEFGSAVPCAAPTHTPTGTPTATPAPVMGPIPVDQRTTDLPAPEARVVNQSVQLVAPMLQSNNKKLKFMGYLFTLTQTSTKASNTAEMQAFWFAALGTKRGIKRELFSRRERISIRKLAPGSYTATYRPVFQSPKSRSKTIRGKSSDPRVFTIR